MSGEAALAALAFNRAMGASGGCFRDAAARIADQLSFDDCLRREAATWLVALFLAPGFGEHDRIFKDDTGQGLAEFVSAHMPPELPPVEEDEAYLALIGRTG